MLTPSGQVAATYYYDAFGNVLETTGNVDNSILFAGYQYDKETGLYYLNARMYDPITARFMQEDTYLGQQNDPLSLNLFTYCHNSPLMYWDPTGHSAEYRQGGFQFGMNSTADNMAQREARRAMSRTHTGRHINNVAEAAQVSAGHGGDTFKAPTMAYYSPAIVEPFQSIVEIRTNKANEILSLTEDNPWLHDYFAASLDYVNSDYSGYVNAREAAISNMLAADKSRLNLYDIEMETLSIQLRDYQEAYFDAAYDSIEPTFEKCLSVAVSTVAGAASTVAINLVVKGPLFIPSLIEKHSFHSNGFERIGQTFESTFENGFVALGADRDSYRIGKSGGNVITLVTAVPMLANSISNLPKTIRTLKNALGSVSAGGSGSLSLQAAGEFAFAISTTTEAAGAISATAGNFGQIAYFAGSSLSALSDESGSGSAASESVPEAIQAPNNRRGLRTAMEKILKNGNSQPEPGMQAHHGLPWRLKDVFAKKGINVNDPQYGAWVQGGKGGHQSWSKAYDKAWTVFIKDNPDPSVQEIEAFFNSIRSNPAYGGGF